MAQARFLTAGIIYVIGNIASAAVPFLLLPVLTRLLSPEEYGLVVSFALMVTLCGTVSGLNAHAALGVVWFKYPREQVHSYTGIALIVALVSTGVIALVAAVVFALVPNLLSGIDAKWAALAALTAGCNVIVQCRLVLWQSQRKPMANIIVQVCASALNVLLSLIAVVVLHGGGYGRNAGIGIASLTMAAVSVMLFVSTKEVVWTLHLERLRNLLRFGAPLTLHTTAAVLLSTADRWIVSTSAGGHALGVYGAGAQLGMIMAVLADAFVKTYGPWIYQLLASEQPEDRFRAVGAVYIAMPMFFVLAFFVGVTITWLSSSLLGSAYSSASEVIPWFMLGGAFTGTYMCTSVLFFFSARTGLLSLMTSAAAFCGVLTTYFFASRFGVLGAAAGYAATQGMLALFVTIAAMRTFNLPWAHPRKALQAWAESVFSGLRRQRVST